MKLKFILTGIIIGTAMCLAVLSLSSFTSQEQAGGYVLLKTYENSAGWDSRIIIIYENGRAEEMILDKIKNPENIISNAKKISDALNIMVKKGYRLISSSNDPNTGTYIFEKK